MTTGKRLRRLQVSFAGLMEKLVLFYTEQMLVKGFFHADPHPGNLLVTSGRANWCCWISAWSAGSPMPPVWP